MSGTEDGYDLVNRFRRTGRPADLERAIAAFRHEVRDATDPAELAVARGNLAAALREKYAATSDVDALRESADTGRLSLSGFPPGDPNRLPAASNHAVTLQALYEKTADAALLDETIALLRGVVRDAGPDHPYRGGFLANLVSALRNRVAADGDPELLDEAVTLGREAVKALPDGERAGALSMLTLVLRARYDATDRVVFLWEAADVGRASIADARLTGRGLAACLSNTAAQLRLLAFVTGTFPLLEEAVADLREAVAVTGPRDANRAAYLANLANSLRDLYGRTGELDRLAQAVAASTEAAELVPDADPRSAAMLSMTCLLLVDLAERDDGDVEPLRMAVGAGRRSVANAGPTHPGRARYLSNLAVALRALAGRADDAETLLREAAAAARDALAVTPARPAEQSEFRTHLGLVLHDLYDRTGDRSALTESVAVFRLAAATVDDAGLGRDGYHQVNLAEALGPLADLTGDEALAREAREHLGRAAASPSFPARLRIQAYQALAARSGTDRAGALAAIEAAVELLPQVVVRPLSRRDREHAAGRLAGLPAQAAAVAVAAGRPDRAAELLEQTRGVLVADALDARSGDRARLPRLAPELAAEFDALRERIASLDQGDRDTDPSDAAGIAAIQARTAARRQADAEWQDLLVRIRATSGLEDFLAPPTADRLAAAAGPDGAVVYVYAHDTGCAALVLAEGAPVTPVPLPGVTAADLARRVARFHGYAPGAARDVEKPRPGPAGDALDVLAWMWDAIAGPILEVVGRLAPTGSSGDLTRVWWCPVGVLADAPLHAAGHHRDGVPGRAVLDRVVSSYTPTVRALADARRRAGSEPARPPATLIVAVPDARGFAELAGARAEARFLAGFVPGATLLTRPSRAEVVTALPAAGVAHFACHGVLNRRDPAASYLALADHADHPMTVAAINDLALPDARLAYLSACDTAQTSAALADEAVHLAAAFHLVGFRSVIGTLWPVADLVAQDVARSVYERITDGGRTAPDAARGAVALHEAVIAARRAHTDQPVLWAAYVHVGA